MASALRVFRRSSRIVAAGRDSATMRTAEGTAPESAVRFHGVARGGAANLVGALVSAGANLLLVVVIARALPPSQAGAVFATTSLFLLVATGARLGTDVSIVHFLAGARA